MQRGGGLGEPALASWRVPKQQQLVILIPSFQGRILAQKISSRLPSEG
jgi:hypothetical protein